MIFGKNNDQLFYEAKKKEYKLIVNSIFSQKINNSLNTKIDQLLENFRIPKEHKKTILITYSIIQKNVDCASFQTSNINHLNLIGTGYEKYKNNFSEFFVELDKLLL